MPKEKESLLQDVEQIQELVKERTESVDGQLEDINEQIKVCLSKSSDIAPISTIPMLTTEEGEFRIELDGGDFDDIDEAAAADFKQALADTGNAEMQEEYYRLQFELESLNKSKKAIIDGDVAWND